MSEFKFATVPPSSLISIDNYNNFFRMKGVHDLRSIQASAPSTQRSFDVQHLEDNEVGRSMQVRMQRPLLFIGQGAKVFDKVKNRKGVVIKAKAGHTSKTNQPVHKICDASGNSWLAIERDLQLII